MLFHAANPRLAKEYAVDFAKSAVMACRRLKIAKDLLFEKAGVLDPEEMIDEQYKEYYDVESPNPPGVL